MLTTTNFKLKKPESTDYAKISDLNDNADIIDAEIAKRPTRDDMDDVIDTKFTTSTARAKLTPGEKLKVLFGKIERWLEDLKDGAFSTVANNVTTTDAGSVLDARQGKALKDQIDTKANKADVVNNLTTTDYGYILDARQGKVLNDKINDAKSSLDASIATKLASANIVNNIATTDAGYALDARQGKVLSDKIDSTKTSLQSSFQAGVDGIYNAITAQGTTPASKSQGDVKTAIGTLATAKYNQGKSDVTLSASASGRTVTATASNGKTASASVAYAGSNGAVSVSTSGGSGNQSFDITDGWCTSINVDRTGAYNQGVSDADGRANSSSTNYKSGYNAGYGACQNAAGTLACSFTGPNNIAEGSYFTFSANQSMSKALVTVAVARDIPSPTINSISCNTGSLTLISSSDSKYDGQVYMRTRQYTWNGNGRPTITVSGTAFMMEWCTIVKLA